MALIKCPECGNVVSDKAKDCIHCGYSMEILTKENDLVNSENFVNHNISMSKLLSNLSVVIKSFIEENDLIKKKRDANDYSEQYIDYQHTVCLNKNFICLQRYLKENKTLRIHKEAIHFLLKRLFESEMYTNFDAVKATLENIDFSILDNNTLTYISTRLREKVQGIDDNFNCHHILYAYPIYQVLFYGSSDINSKLLFYLNQQQPALGPKNKFDGMLEVLPKMNITPSQKVLSLQSHNETQIEKKITIVPKQFAKTFNTKKIPDSLYWFLVVVGAIVGAILMFAFWGLEWYQENELELEYGIFSIVFLIIHLIPIAISIVIGGGIGFITGGLIAAAIDLLIYKLCETETDSSGKKIIFTKPRKLLLIVIITLLAIPTSILIIRGVEKQNIRSEITIYLSSEYGLENIEIKFTQPYSDVWDYGVIVYSSNLNSLSYEEMTRIEYYLTSHTELKAGDVNIERYVCNNDSYVIYTTSVYKNGDCVYEYKTPPSYSVTSAEAPYVGMDAEYIGSTKLGSPDKTERCRDYAALRPERRTITYKWYDSNGKMIYYAFVINDKVTSVTDYRK